MTAQISYADVYAPLFELCGLEPPHVGDVVATGRSDWPRFEVVAVWDAKAWVRNLDNDEDAIVPAERCRVLRAACH